MAASDIPSYSFSGQGSTSLPHLLSLTYTGERIEMELAGSQARRDETPEISQTAAKLCLLRGLGIKLKDASWHRASAVRLVTSAIHYSPPLLMLVRLDSFISLNFLENLPDSPSR